jgi:hypothetical protein
MKTLMKHVSTPPQSPCTFIPSLPEPQSAPLAREMPYGELLDDPNAPCFFEVRTVISASTDEFAF